ncbi:hypothetical protein AAY473_037008 [Plecturocebus cupreus]
MAKSAPQKSKVWKQFQCLLWREGIAYLIDRAFIATPQACVKLSQAYLDRIGISVECSPLHMEKSSSNCEMWVAAPVLLCCAWQDVYQLKKGVQTALWEVKAGGSQGQEIEAILANMVKPSLY